MRVVALWVEFIDGPAAGITREYPHLNIALPSLFWADTGDPMRCAVYRRNADAPDSTTGKWRYGVTNSWAGTLAG